MAPRLPKEGTFSSPGVVVSASVAAAAAALLASGGQALTVAEARKTLAEMRRAWADALSGGDKPPFHFGEKLWKPCTLEQFALGFVLSHHSRRLAKSRK